jgi:hypothetical protein
MEKGGIPTLRQKSNRRSFDSLRCAPVAQDDRLYIYQSLTFFLFADTPYAVYFAASYIWFIG